MEIVAEKHVGGRGLRRSRFQRRMRRERGHRRRPARIRDADDADAAIVIGHVFDQPLDRVVGIGHFVHKLRIVLEHGDRRALHHELAFGFVASADVLEDEGVAVAGERAEFPLRPVRIFGRLIGRAFEDDRQWAGGIFRREDVGVQLHAVAHRDHRVCHIERRRDRLVRARLIGVAGQEQETSQQNHSGLRFHLFFSD